MKSYLRFLSRNKLYTVIMGVGLSVALAFVIIMSCFVWQGLSVNRTYPDQDRMYAIGGRGNVMSNMAMTQTMMDAIPEIESGTTMKVLSMYPSSSIEGTDIGQGFYMGVYKEFFDLFPTKFIHGSVEVFNDLGNAIVTEIRRAEEGVDGRSEPGRTEMADQVGHDGGNENDEYSSLTY